MRDCYSAALPLRTPPTCSSTLVQDAAYSTLLRGRRQELHARVAAAVEAHFADLVERQPELLAHHLTAAGDSERAVEQWLKAGQHAAARSAHYEAIGHCDRGIALLRSLPDTPDRNRREIELELTRGPSLLTAKGFNSPEAVEAYERARGLCEKCGDTDNLFVALWNLWLTTSSRNALSSCRSLNISSWLDNGRAALTFRIASARRCRSRSGCVTRSVSATL
jgi:predicted ATPase